MTTENFYTLAVEGKLDLERLFVQKQMPNYCVAAAIDRVFSHVNVPISIYEMNDREMLASESGDESSGDRFFTALGETVFGIRGQDFLVTPYEFNTYQEFQSDITELRNCKATILIDVRDGKHSLGLRPVTGKVGQWEVVGGVEDLVCVYSRDANDVEVQAIRNTEPKTSLQIWDYMLANNSETYRPLTAVVLPPEPAL